MTEQSGTRAGGYGALLVQYLRPQRGRIALLAALLFANIALQLANPLILRALIDAALAGRPLDSLLAAGGAFLGLALLAQGLALAETYVAETAGWTATNTLRTDLARHLLRLDMGFHHAHPPGELIERIDGDVSMLANFFSRFVLLIVGNILLLGGVLVVLWGVDWRAGLALSLFAALALPVLRTSGRRGLGPAGTARQAGANLYSFLEERLAGIEDLRANGAGAYVLRGFYERIRTQFFAVRRARVAWALVGLTGIGLFTLGYLGAVALGAGLFSAGAISLGTVYLVLYYTELLQRPLAQLADQIGDLQQAGAGIRRVQDLWAHAPTRDESGRAPLPPGPLPVEFAAVTFGYGAGPPVLQDLSFRVAPGRVLGVVGRTGSGKSTLARLLLRLYDPDAGAVLVGGADLRALAPADLHRRVGLVTQEVHLFAATVRDNLTLFAPAVSDARLLTVLRALDLGAWYDALPQGLDTELAAGGEGLSAGEAQLLAFARVFLQDPGLVILDEASSRLDPATEGRIAAAVEVLLRGRTAIIIAHRLATVARADDILVLDAGRVAEHAPRAALAADPESRFAGLLQVGRAEVPV